MLKNLRILDNFPRKILSHAPTPLEQMPNLKKQIGLANLYIKRDDCTGLAMGGNKARQLEFYIGEAIARQADTIIITGAIQSNFTRMAAAAACKTGLGCHIQLENRVENSSPIYRNSGNVLLSRLCGATMHDFPAGQDEKAADQSMEDLAGELRQKGKKPYIIHLAPGHPPLGSLGYVVAAEEIIGQIRQSGVAFDKIVVASGSGSTHAGLLFGLRACGNKTVVKGICVRRSAGQQRSRIFNRCQEIANLLKMKNPVTDSDIDVSDDVLAPGYGHLNDSVAEAISLTAHKEGIILDPVYTGKTMASFLIHAGQSKVGQNLLFWHTGGQPAVFGYETELSDLMCKKQQTPGQK